MTFKPFADDTASLAIGELTVENGADRLSVYGSMEITRDKVGLQHALRLKAVLDQAVADMHFDTALPDALPPERDLAPVKVANPLA